MDRITAEELLALERSQRYKRQLADADVFPDARNWKYITEYVMESLAPELYRKFLLAWLTPESQRSDFHELALECFPDYLGAIPRQTALETVYSDITSSPEATLHLVDVCRLFDARRLMRLLDEDADPHFVAQCLGAYQPEYTAADVRAMSQLVQRMHALPDQGSLKESHSIFGRDVRLVCPNGHSVSIEAGQDPEDCFCPTCDLNIQGLTSDDADAIKSLANRVSILRASGL